MEGTREQKRSDRLPAWIMTILLASLMTGAAEVFGDNEIIFPEIAALTLGYVFAPKRAWQVNSLRMFLLISVGAVLGFCISVFVPGPLYFKVLLAFVLAQLVYLYSGTGLAPLISAIVLPVLIGTKSLSYVASAVVMTALVILCHTILVRFHLLPLEPYTPVPKPDRAAFQRFLVRLLVVVLLAIPAITLNLRYLIAPPLLVAFTELVDHWRPESEKKPPLVFLLFSLCAACGAGVRGFLTVYLGLPLFVSAAVAVFLMLCFVTLFRLYMPPAGALTMLAMLIPEAALVLYVPEVMAATCLFLVVAVLWNRRR